MASPANTNTLFKGASLANQQPRVHIGILAFRDEASTLQEWHPTLLWLQQQIPGYHFELVPGNLDVLNEALRNQTLDFIITNPGHYVEMEAAYGISRILTQIPVNDANAAYATGSVIITQANQGKINSLSDLRNRSLATISTDAFGGYQIVWRELKPLGINPDKDIRIIQTEFPMNNVLEAVKNGSADAGIIRACLLETVPDWSSVYKVVNQQKQTHLPCITSTRLYPGWAIATLRSTSPELAGQVALALLHMQAQPSTTGDMMWSVPADYQSVHELFRELKIGPYKDPNDNILIALVQRYWPWLIGIFGVGIAWIFYTVRVEQLVRQRTRELEQSYAQQRQLQEQMRQAQEQADHQSRLSILGEMSGTLAHELNQPLATIDNYARGLIRRADHDRLTVADTHLAATEIAQQTERMSNIIGSIRSFVHKHPSRRVKISPNHIAKQAIHLFSSMLAQAPRVTLVDQLPLQISILVDPLQTQQVLLNLLKNGWDAMADLPPAEQQLVLTLWCDAENVHFSVQDFGCGLDPSVEKRLFEPFVTTKSNGLGLGLAICRTIAETHRGHLSVSSAAVSNKDSKDAPGTVFTLTLPHTGL